MIRSGESCVIADNGKAFRGHGYLSKAEALEAAGLLE